jgi:rod shape-determining protein MreC
MHYNASRSKVFINILVLMLSFYGISQKDYTSSEPSYFERILMSLFSPLQSGLTTLGNNVSYLTNNYIFLVNASKENEHLKAKIEGLETQLINKWELERENKRLKELLRFGQEEKKSRVLAQVISWDAHSNFKVLRINKGTNDGLRRFDVVVTAKGLVGYVYRTSFYYADILTVLDQNNRVDSLVARTRSHGVVEGYTDTSCQMKYVTRTEPVKLNDVILTSGLSRIYPKGLVLGRIGQIRRESYGTTQFIEVVPEVNFDKLEEVIVLVQGSESSDDSVTDGEES